MRLKSLNQLRRVRLAITGLRAVWLRTVQGIAIDPTASLSLSARFVSHVRGSITIGADTLIAFKTLLIADAGPGTAPAPIQIGQRCFIGGGATILPGVTIGDESIIAAGAVVFDDVPPRSIVAGNPARIVRSDIVVGRFGRLAGADDNSRKMWQP
jgi:acetyltransferase-like isoleucine patch superfamily enzyme